LIRYRPFENRDPPGLAEIWRTQRPIRGRIQSVTSQLLEEHVFAKPWFDRQGLIVACEGARPVGFIHAGFGADCTGANIECSQGTTCLILVAPHDDRTLIATELLAASEDYIRRHGAKELFAGSQFPLNPFYLGLYGSSDVGGVLKSNAGWVDPLTACPNCPKSKRCAAASPQSPAAASSAPSVLNVRGGRSRFSRVASPFRAGSSAAQLTKLSASASASSCVSTIRTASFSSPA
jgi:hypothetical protein